MTHRRTVAAGLIAGMFLVAPVTGALADSSPTYPPSLGGGTVSRVVPAPASPSDGGLPFTGAPLAALAGAGLLIAVGGAGLLVVARRRRAGDAATSQR